MLMLELVQLPVQVKEVLPIERVSLQGLTPLVTQEAELGTDGLLLRIIQPGPGARLARSTVLQELTPLYIGGEPAKGATDLLRRLPSRTGARADGRGNQ
jgi:hypothetical protein